MYVFKDSLGRIAGELSRNIGKVLVIEFQKVGFTISAKEWGAISYLFNNKQVSKSDRRHYELNLTKKGIKVYDELSPIAARIIALSSRDIHEVELQLMIKTLKKANENLKSLINREE